MLSILTPHPQKKEQRDARKLLEVDDVYYLDCGDGFMGACMSKLIKLHIKCVAFCVSIIPQ